MDGVKCFFEATCAFVESAFVDYGAGRHGFLPFKEVAREYFAEAVAWLAAAGITSGYPDGLFHPGDAVTRAQMVTFLDRFAR